MALELERRFLIEDPAALPPLGPPVRIVQAFLSTSPVVRVRLLDPPPHATLTVKGPGLGGRLELEYPVPVEEARAMAALSPWAPIVKDRFRVGRIEVDRFLEGLAGLWIAEIELARPDEPVRVPAWCGRELTFEPAWSNAALARAGRPPLEA